MKKENLMYQRFNRLLVIAPAPSRNKKTYWQCKCDCGNICIARADQLKNGKTQSCGCLNKEHQQILGKYNIQDITNQKFGKLTAKQRLSSRQNSILGYDWLCQCECGKQVIVPITYLKNNNNISCGCAKESTGEKKLEQLFIKYNIVYEKQKTFSDLRSIKNKLLHFDFYLPAYNCVIEFDGPQHYTKTNYTTIDLLENDKIKNQWSLTHMPLYRIPYNYLSQLEQWNINHILNKQFLVKNIEHYQIKI